MMTTPGPRSLYRPEYEHDSCGVAFVVDMYGRQSRDIVEKAIAALVNLEHRGAVGAEANTCLLYTSPSPRDQRGSRMPSSA